MIEPFFIIGFQRSGTTLLRLMLYAHPDIAIPLDTVGLWSVYEDRLGDYGDLSVAANRGRLVTDILCEERIRLWETPFSASDIVERWKGATYPALISAFYEAYAAAHGKTRWADKDPGNMVRIDQLNRWFPSARFVHIIRDGRDACLSLLAQSFGSNNLLECARDWREEVEWVRRMGSVLGPQRYYEFRYEDLVTQPHSTLEVICHFLGIEFTPSMLNYHKDISGAVPEEKRHIWPMLTQAPRADNTERWKRKLSHAQRVCFEKRAGRVLKVLGYEVLSNGASGAYLEEIRSLVSSGVWAVRRRL